MKIKSTTNRPLIKQLSVLLGALAVLVLLVIFLPQINKKKAPKPTEAAQENLYESLDVIEIKVDEEEYNKLRNKRDEAIKANLLIASSDDFVKGRILFNGTEHKGELRLKGDWVDHLIGDNWSFRIKLGKDETILGMRKFSLHHPKTRNYAGEWLFHQLLEEAGILNLQYHFVHFKLTVNGREQKDLGIYALEEGFAKYLVERNRRREGVLLKIDEGLIWEERADFMEKNLALWYREHLGVSTYDNLPVKAFGQGKVMEDSAMFRQFEAGRELFESYARGDKKISEVFDVELLAKYNAICNALGANHALYGHNYRVYYNPVTARLEPVGFDANAGKKQHSKFKYMYADEDETYMRAYAAAMEECSSDEYYEHIINFPGLRERVALLQSVYPEFKWNDKDILHDRYLMMNAIYPRKGINIFLEEKTSEYIRVTVDNFTNFPVQIYDLLTENGRAFASEADETIISAHSREQITLRFVKNYQRLFINKKKKKAGFDIKKDLEAVQVTYRVLDVQKVLKTGILPWKFKNKKITDHDIFKEKPKINYHFLEVDDSTKVIRVKKGDWKLEETIVIPEGYTFKMGPGSGLEMVKHNSKIISYSPIELMGSVDNPVNIYSTTNMGQGIIVLNTQDTSIINHAKFTNLSNPRSGGWLITGAINFYEAPLKMTNSMIINNQSEDGLNCIRGYFELENVVFSGTKSDAFDGDFVNGKIINCTFRDIGNDAIDVSGSTIYVEDVRISKAGDKGLSAGENSEITAKKIIVTDSEIAVASKDKSLLILSESLLKNCKLAFTAFQKKSEFGTAQIIGTNIDLENIELLHLIETGSSLELNGATQTTVDTVKDRMYGVDFGKSSK